MSLYRPFRRFFSLGSLAVLLAGLSTSISHATKWDQKTWPPPTSTADVTASVPVSAAVTVSPPAITLNFIRSGKYQIFRKAPAATTWGTAIATLTTDVNTYTDSTVAVGQLYEYKCILTDAPASPALIHLPPAGNFGLGNGTPGSPIGYIMTGINVDETLPRGRVIVVVASNVLTNLPTEYGQYISDLQADGWFVHQITVAPGGYDVGGTNAAATITVTAQGTGYVAGAAGTTDATGLVHFINSKGNAALGTLTVSSGAVTAVTVSTGGAGGSFTVGDVLTASNIKSATGTGATFAIGSVQSNGPNPAAIHAQIQAIYTQYLSDPNPVKNVIMVGRVPACRSGLFENDDPDGHAVNMGATGADGYYASMSGNWTDTGSNLGDYNIGGITISSGELNTPGDGKFDAMYMQQTGGEADMGFGRIDTSNGIFSQYEALKAYFRKLHRFKTCSSDFLPGRRIILRTGDFENVDNTCWTMADGVVPPTVTPNANPALPPTITYPNIDNISGSELPAVTASLDSDAAYSALHGPYLFYYKGSGGPGIGIGGQAVFWTGCQSHWGWWYSSTTSSGENSEALRLGENSFGLSWTWSIFGTHYFYHRMDMGFDAGDMARVSVNNADSTTGTYAFVTDPNTQDGGAIFVSTGGLFMNHIGDPTLRFFMVVPPTQLSVIANSGQAKLTWTGSTDSNLVGYHVYRAPLSAGAITAPYSRLTSTPFNTPDPGTTANFTFVDTDPTAQSGTGQWSYMVKAVKSELTGSGTFFNASLGAVGSVDQTNPPATLAITTPAALPAVNWNTPYTTTLAATGGTPIYTWSLVSGALPPGMGLAANGAFTGAATTSGNYSFTAKVTDDLGQTAQQAFTVTSVSNGLTSLIPEVSSYVFASSPFRVQGSTEFLTVSGNGGSNGFLRYNVNGVSLNNAFASATLRVYVLSITNTPSIATLGVALTSDDYINWHLNSDTAPAIPITSAVNNGSNAYRITATNHGLDPKYDAVSIASATTTALNTEYANYKVIDANTFDLPPTLVFNASNNWTGATATALDGITFSVQPHDNPNVLPVYSTTPLLPLTTVDVDVTTLVNTALAHDPSGKIGFRLFTNSSQGANFGSAYAYAGAIPQLILQTTNAPNISITSPTLNPVPIITGSSLAVTATITALPSTAAGLTAQWSQVSGPTGATFSNPTPVNIAPSPMQANTMINFPGPGTYVFQLAANDGVLQSFKTLTVRVLTLALSGPTDAMIFRMPFDETSGNPSDTAGNNGTFHSGSLQNGATYSSAGKINGCATFSGTVTTGTSSRVDINDTTTNSLDGMTNLAISLWVKPSAGDVDGNFHGILCKRTGSFNKESYTIQIRGNTLSGNVNNSSGSSAGNKVFAGTWYHVAMVFKGGTSPTCSFYLNGNLESSNVVTATVVPTNPTSPLHIGAYDSVDTKGWGGQIDEVRIYNRVLTLAEIQDLATAVPPDIGPVITTSPTLAGNAGQPLPLDATVTGQGTITTKWGELNGPTTLTIASPSSLSTSTTPSQAGTYNIQISANDGTITTFANVAATITGPPVQTYSTWATGFGLSGPNASQTAILGHDGLNNLFKYALGLTPTTTYNPGDSHLPQVTVPPGTNFLTLSFDGVATDVTYTVQASSDMVNWTPIYVYQSGQGVAPGNVTVTDTVAINSQQKRFLRLLMTNP